MTGTAASEPATGEVRQVEELLRALSKGQRALQMYLPNNPIYQRAIEQVAEAFAPVWGFTGRLVLHVEEDQILWDEAPVFRQTPRTEGLAWQLHKDGLRRVTFLPGVETEEIQRFLQVTNRARMLPADASDDLLTLLWEQEFVLISYLFVEALGDGMETLHESRAGRVSEGAAAGGGTAMARDEVETARSESPAGDTTAPGAPRGLVDLKDFDATPYFLEDLEIRRIQSELADEYRRDIRSSAIDALLDTLEAQSEPAVRREALALLEEILPAQLSTGGFRVVARMLRELRIIASRAAATDGEFQQAVLSFEERLSTPEVLEHLFRVLEDIGTRPPDEDISDVMGELKPVALPALLTHLARVADPSVRRVLESSIDRIAGNAPQILVTMLQAGNPDAIIPAIALSARLHLQPTVPAIVEYLKTGDEPTRIAAVYALAEFGTPTTVGALESALHDDERGVRQAALTLLMNRGGSGGLLRHLEALLFDGRERDWERSERRSLFEAYGQIGGDATVPKLRELLEPKGVFRRRESPELRACALYALGKVGSFEARLVVDHFTADKEPVVRSAANSVLREWTP